MNRQSAVTPMATPEMSRDSTMQPIARNSEYCNLPLCTRLMPLGVVSSVNRCVDLVWTTGVSVRRYDWLHDRVYLEQLSQEVGAVRMARLQSGTAPLLNTHSDWNLSSVLGVVESATSPADGGTAVVRFSKRDEVEPVFQDVKDGILTSVSLGAKLHKINMIAPGVEGNTEWIYRAVDWEPLELSLVPIGADPGATIRHTVHDAGFEADEVRETSPSSITFEAENMPRYFCECVTVTRNDVECASATCTNLLATPAITAVLTSVANQGITQAETSINLLQKGSTMSTEEQQQMRDSAVPGIITHIAEISTMQAPVASAEPDGGVGNSEAGAMNAITQERLRVRNIREAVRASTLDSKEQLIDGYIDRGLPTNVVLADVLRRMANISSADDIQRQTRSQAYSQTTSHFTMPYPHIETVVDEAESRREAMMLAVMHRVAPDSVKLTDHARMYRGMTLRELCRHGLDVAGISTRGMGPMELAGMALGLSQRGLHATSDLPLIFGGVISRTLRAAYDVAPKTFIAWARRGVLSDFRPVTRASFDAAVKFEKIGQSGEYKYGTLIEGGEVIQLGTYGKIVAFTRQMIINDDLSALERLPQFFGRAAADMESDLVYDILTANSGMADGKPLFHLDHGNLAAVGTVININSLSEARALMRVQKSAYGSTLNLSAKTLLVPAALETIANQYTSSAYNPMKPGDVNVFQGTLTPVIEARLDAKSATAWYLLCDPVQIDTVEYAYLDGEEGMFTEQNTDFDVDGIKVKGRIDFAAKAIDHRGLFRNDGAKQD